MALATWQNKKTALKALQKRRKNPLKKIDNASLYAGSPMYYYCKNCGRLTDTLPKGHHSIPNKFCDECQAKDNPKNNPTRKFLNILSDGSWHVYNKLPSGVSVDTVRFCIDQGFVATKMVDRKRQGNFETYRTALRITRHGRTALRKQ